MAVNSKQEAVAAGGRVAAAMEAFTQKFPDWEHRLDQAMADNNADTPEEMKPFIEAWAAFLLEACHAIKNWDIEESAFFKLFPQRFHSSIQELIASELRVFHAFSPLYTVYSESRFKAENIIDQIWQQYVLRFNPYRKIERPGSMSDEDMANLEKALDALADYCCMRMLHYDAIVQRIKQEINLPEGLCDYIARKIDKDYHEICLNHIITRLKHLEDKEDASEQS